MCNMQMIIQHRAGPIFKYCSQDVSWYIFMATNIPMATKLIFNLYIPYICTQQRAWPGTHCPMWYYYLHLPA